MVFSSGASLCVAQDFPGLANPFSPIFSFPPLQAEARGTLIWMNLLKGSESAPSVPATFDFKKFWGMDQGAAFLDAMVRLQVGPFSARLHSNMRYFKGTDSFPASLAGVGVAAFDYTGLRIGGDFDVLRWGRSRVGIDMDYDLYHPVVTATGISELTGPSAMTLGFHAVYNPSYNFYGFSAVGEGRARWSIVGSQISDWEISAGLKGPETVLGSVAIMTGYRRTNVAFSDWVTVGPPWPQQTAVPVRANIDVSMGGWFGQLAYYY
ncbi:MAG: hypothetical protein HY912_17725 [Desulfomonile tiedjei]|uniref:Uncharacterized protein n=1 Tax=Desulfomonile tiedjei TaxID=2358 RepID=A0A9D6V3C2_9BACT|nr:hypothetical protein [Desulfomonile tiedjei]